jgi:hypothetical protein
MLSQYLNSWTIAQISHLVWGCFLEFAIPQCHTISRIGNRIWPDESSGISRRVRNSSAIPFVPLGCSSIYISLLALQDVTAAAEWRNVQGLRFGAHSMIPYAISLAKPFWWPWIWDFTSACWSLSSGWFCWRARHGINRELVRRRHEKAIGRRAETRVYLIDFGS